MQRKKIALLSFGTVCTWAVFQWAVYRLQLTSENCLKLSVCNPLLCKSGTPIEKRVFIHVSKNRETILFFSDTEKHLLGNLDGFEKMAYKGTIVFSSESFISTAIYFAEFNFENIVV